MLDDFAVFILTHGRPDRVITHDTLRRSGYTGRIHLVIDDEDAKGDAYRERFGDSVLTFSKAQAAEITDDGDNFGGRRGVVFARNACFDLAEMVGCRYFVQLDDDYDEFRYRATTRKVGETPRVNRTLDALFDAVLEFFKSVPGMTTIALAQGGDFLGGCNGINEMRLPRKAMNSFFCDTHRRFRFFGRINEDVSSYVTNGRRGDLFFTVMSASLNQPDTQKFGGGLTELYLDTGTYAKSFYSVMYAPSCVQIGQIGDPRSPHYRIHHMINWHRAVPKILAETCRKRSGDPAPAR
jgi:hypothetical protein